MVGNSLVPLLKGRNPNEWRSDIYYHYYDFPAQHQVRRHDGVRDNRYKLIHFYDAKKKHLVVMNYMIYKKIQMNSIIFMVI